jgi:DUF971 family protein
MRPLDVQQIGNELAIKWEDGGEMFIALETLRRRCPCAGCMGEQDVMGNIHQSAPQALSSRAFLLTKLEAVGGYGIKPIWGDGHATGIFSFDYLRRLAEAGEK